MGESYVVLGCDGGDEVFEGEFEESGGASSGIVDCVVEGCYGVYDLFASFSFLANDLVEAFGWVGHDGSFCEGLVSVLLFSCAGCAALVSSICR